MGKHKIKQLSCACCDKKYLGSTRAKYCPECAGIVHRIRVRYNNAGLRIEGDIVELVRKERKELSEKQAADQTENTPQYCKFCEVKLSQGNTTGYCRRCKHEGFHEVHQATGRTKYGNVRRNPKAAVQSGWRGQTVLGGAIKIR